MRKNVRLNHFGMKNQRRINRNLLLFSFLLFLLTISVRDAAGQPNEYDEYGIGLPRNLGPVINSEWAEIVPVASPDGQRLYFSRKEAPENTGGKDDLEDIYYSERQADGSWGPPLNAGAPLNSPGSDVLFSFSSDGKAALVYHGREVNGKEVGLAITRWKNGGWTEPQKIDVEGLESLGDYYYAFMTGDGKHLFISYSPINNPVDLDIFYSEALSNDMMRWSKPEQMGALNGPFIDGSPFLAPDNRTLFMISDRIGSNLADIYVSLRSGDGWRNWTHPEPLRGYVSSPMFETSVSVTPDGKGLYVSHVITDRTEGGRTDLYFFTLPDTLKLSHTFVLRGKVIDRKTGKGIESTIRISPQRETRVVARTKSKPDGSFDVALVPGYILTIKAEAPGYEAGGTTFEGRVLDLPGEIPPITIELQKKGGGVVETPTNPVIRFATGSAAISNADRRTLRRFAERLQGTRETIEIVGYTDSVGTAEENQRLGLERAENVKRFLMEAGIAASRMATGSFGEEEPTGNNGNARGRAANRRVEIRVSE